MEVNDALEKLGVVGRWQILHYTTLCVASSFTPCFHLFSILYIGAWPGHHCRVPEGSLINETIPLAEDGKYSQCEVYADQDRNKTIKCTEWQYVHDDVGYTVVSQWDLVCERSYLKDLTQTILVLGVMFGAVICTILSDKLGRKPVFFYSQWAMIVVGVINAFAPNYYVFAVFRFCTGILLQGIAMPSFVMVCELFAAKYRTFAGIIIGNFWAAAMCCIALLAYLLRNWVHIQLFISLFGLLTIPLYRLLPESVVWLHANNRVAEAEEIIRKAARMNSIVMPDKILVESHTTETAAVSDGTRRAGGQSRSFGASEEKIRNQSSHYTVFDIFRNRHSTINLFCIILLWMVVTLVYYGLSLSAGQLAGNLYVNGFISGFVEIPACTSAFFASQKFGRKKSLIAFYATSGISLILSQVTPEQTGFHVSLVPLKIALNMVAKCAITAAFCVIFLYTPEIFPTTIRSQALGIASFAGRVSSMLAPFTSLVAKEVRWLPGILFGCLSTAAGLLMLLLPETLQRPLPQTIEDVEQFYSTRHTVQQAKSAAEFHERRPADIPRRERVVASST